MKKILVPVDFSYCSLDALRYAQFLAEELGFGLKVIHVYSGSLDTNAPFVVSPGKTRLETMEERLEEFVENLNYSNPNTATSIALETQVIQALRITPQIVKSTNADDVAMVVLGTTGNGNIMENVLGGVATAVAQQANCPVLLIPKSTTFHSIKNILYASNYESTSYSHIEQVINFGKIFRAAMHFVHVEEKDNYETIENEIFEQIFEKGDPNYVFNIVNLKGVSILEGLTQYAEENNIDLMVVVNRQRSFLNNLFGQSLTKKMSNHTQIPLMVFHLD